MANKPESGDEWRKLVNLCNFVEDEEGEFRDMSLEELNRRLEDDGVDSEEAVKRIQQKIDDIKKEQDKRSGFAAFLESIKSFLSPKKPAFQFSLVLAILLVGVFTFKPFDWQTESTTRGPSTRPIRGGALQEIEKLNKQILQLFREGQYEKAIPISINVLALVEKNKGADHVDTAAVLNNQAVLYKRVGSLAKAQSLYTRALKIQEAHLGINHPDTIETMKNMALLYEKMEENTKAEDIYKRILEIHRNSFGEDHATTQESLNSLVEFYKNVGAAEEIPALLSK